MNPHQPYSLAKRKSIVLFVLLYLLFIARTYYAFPFLDPTLWFFAHASEAPVLFHIVAFVGYGIGTFIFYGLSLVFSVFLMAGFSGFGSAPVPQSPLDDSPKDWSPNTPEKGRDVRYTRFLLLSVYPLSLGLPLFPWLSGYQFIILSVGMMIPALLAHEFGLYYIHREVFPLLFWMYGQASLLFVCWVQIEHPVLDILAYGLLFMLIGNLTVFHFLKQRLDIRVATLKLEQEKKDFYA